MSDPNGNGHKPGTSSGGNGNGNGNGNGDRLTLGRGRGRGSLPEQRLTDTDSESNKRSGAEQQHAGESKRGRVREGRDIQQIAYTKPSHVNSKKGSVGTPINLLTNHFQLRFNPKQKFRLYRIDFAPDVDDLKLRKALIYQHNEVLGAYIYDGGNLIYLLIQLDSEEFVSRSRENVDYKILFRDTKNEIEFSTSMGVMVLNTILRRAMDGLKLMLVQRNLYDPNNAIDFRDYRLQLWPGYITSIRQFEQDVLICCEISHKVMRQETVLDVLTNFTRDGGNYREAFEREITNTVVLTGYNNNTYSIVGVKWDATPQTKFQGRDGEESFIEYYKRRYNLVIREAGQPLLITRITPRDIRGGRTEPALLVPELCRTTGLTDNMRNNFNLMKALGEYTRMNPNHRVDRLRRFATRIKETAASTETLRRFGVKMEPTLLSIKGRILDSERILFGNNKAIAPDAKTADWTPALRNNSQFANETLKKWILMYPRKTADDTERFLEMMKEVSNGLRFEISEPKKIELSDDRTTTYARELTEVCKKDPKLIMVVFMGNPQSNGERYATVKKITCVQNAIPTQCIVSKTMQPKKGNMAGVKSIATKVILQINCKLGGAPWMVGMPMSGVMICGFDVSHNTAARNAQSYGAFVSTMDLKTCNKFFSSIAAHNTGEECASNIRIHMQKAIYAFKDEHGTLPARIIFYRDGVGDGQINMIVETELAEIKKMLASMYKDTNGEFKFAFVIVNKRINTRFFEEKRGQFENPIPGTVVDDVVTLPERYDFFLVSQSVRQGTVSPTSYNIVYDTFGLPPDKQQMLAYKMCHLYYNWCGTTRVPCVVQYAHKLSVLVGEHIRQVPNTGLDKKLYYL